MQSLSRAIQPPLGTARALGHRAVLCRGRAVLLLSRPVLWGQHSVLQWLLYAAVVAFVPWQHVLPALAQAQGAAVGSSGPVRARAGDGAVLAPAGDAAPCEGPRQRGQEANGAQPGILVMSGRAVTSVPRCSSQTCDWGVSSTEF